MNFFTFFLGFGCLSSVKGLISFEAIICLPNDQKSVGSFRFAFLVLKHVMLRMILFL
uniref:Uncharacterized protein n=1 Tax=Rhizophora mucronata TaxID=61149 RepID=A0A2P2PP31_RHIMU